MTQYCNYSLILSMIAKIGSFYVKMTLLILVLRAYGSRLSVIIFFSCIYYNYYLIPVRQYSVIAIILADQNHVIWLLQRNNSAMYVIYWIIIAQVYTKHNMKGSTKCLSRSLSTSNCLRPQTFSMNSWQFMCVHVHVFFSQYRINRSYGGYMQLIVD